MKKSKADGLVFSVLLEKYLSPEMEQIFASEKADLAIALVMAIINLI